MVEPWRVAIIKVVVVVDGRKAAIILFEGIVLLAKTAKFLWILILSHTWHGMAWHCCACAYYLYRNWLQEILTG